MASSIASAFARLDQVGGPLPLSTILEWFHDMPFTADNLAPYLIFRPERYVRNLLYTGPAYQALVLCWRNGQRSPIHNHRGSNCGVKVLRGIATETLFRKAPNGLIVPVSSRDLPTGHVCASSDEDVHQISNLQAGHADLVTLHVYSPPLVRMDMFALDSPAIQEWDDPINDPFPLGGGI
jgi:cysteine dioxygenase